MEKLDLYITKIIGDITLNLESYMYLEPLFILLAGFITSFLPCTLTMIPIVLMYLRGKKEMEQTQWHMFKITSILTLGMVVSSTVLGLIVALTSNVLQLLLFSKPLFIGLGVLSILLSLQMVGVLKPLAFNWNNHIKVKKSLWGAFVLGAVIGVFSSPCSTPMLIMLLNRVAMEGELLRGGIYLAIYGFGHGIVFIILGFLININHKIFLKGNIYGIIVLVINGSFALITFLLGVYLLYKGV